MEISSQILGHIGQQADDLIVALFKLEKVAQGDGVGNIDGSLTGPYRCVHGSLLWWFG